MDPATILSLVKARLGISATVRDEYLTAIIKGILTELDEEKGIKLNKEDNNHLMFVVNYAAWKYDNRDSNGAMPRHLQWDLHNLFLSSDENVQP